MLVVVVTTELLLLGAEPSPLLSEINNTLPSTRDPKQAHWKYTTVDGNKLGLDLIKLSFRQIYVPLILLPFFLRSP